MTRAQSIDRSVAAVARPRPQPGRHPDLYENNMRVLRALAAWRARRYRKLHWWGVVTDATTDHDHDDASGS